MLSSATLDFAWQHRHEDTTRLLLGKVPKGVDMKGAAQQIEGWQAARTKWPSLSANPLLIYPPRLNREQASSEATATYKASLMSTIKVADLTGGMGIDTMALAAKSKQVDYFELNAELCHLMQHNTESLGINNITVHNEDGLSACGTYDLALIDPARRDASGRRVTAFEDCTPDILSAMPRLQQITRRLMIKASPMVDIALALKQLPPVSELHIVAIRGECKELLFIIEFGQTQTEPKFHCVNLQSGSTALSFLPSEARAAEATVLQSNVPTSGYLFDPDATIMKAGCHALVASLYGLSLLGHNSHLYYGTQPIEDFPGRVFEIIAETALTRHAIAPLLPDGKANIISRNHPVAADTLRRQLHIADGGDLYLIATTVAAHHTAFVCSRRH